MSRVGRSVVAADFFLTHRRAQRDLDWSRHPEAGTIALYNAAISRYDSFLGRYRGLYSSPSAATFLARAVDARNDLVACAQGARERYHAETGHTLGEPGRES